MSEPMRVGLDNPIFNGRLRMPRNDKLPGLPAKRSAPQRFDQQVRKSSERRSVVSTAVPVWKRPLSYSEQPAPLRKITGHPYTPQAMPPASHSTIMPTANNNIVQPVGAVPIEHIPQNQNSTLHTDARRTRHHLHRLNLRTLGYTKMQTVLLGMALIVFVGGLLVGLQTMLTNHESAAQVAALSRKADSSQNGSLPSTVKPSSSAVAQYIVAPDLPRYIKIPKLGVNARVLQVGVTNSGALGTPNNVYDAAWYTGSAKPGQQGATLIDGHVSSWTTHGVFYGLKLLHPGDQIQIQRGDGQILTYQVVKSQTYADNKVDMKAAMTPVVAGKSGLNLITCTGQVKSGTSEFNQRIIVFTEQV